MEEEELSLHYEDPGDYNGDLTDRVYNWFLTINNYSIQELEEAERFPSTYKLIAKEIAPTTGTPHIHMYYELKNAKTFSKMKKVFPRANIKIALGNAQQNKKYLSKECLYLEEGTPKKQGNRKDIEIVRELLDKGGKIRECIRSVSSYQSIRIAEIHLKYFEKARNWKPKIVWIHGPTGTGKSRMAFSRCEGHDTYVAMENNRWWEGYDGHSHVIIDDIREDSFPFKTLLRMLDRYEYRIECKGGSRQFLAKEIYITAPKSPHQMFQFCGEAVGQLTRRIDEIIFLDEYIEEESDAPTDEEL